MLRLPHPSPEQRATAAAAALPYLQQVSMSSMSCTFCPVPFDQNNGVRRQTAWPV